MSVNQIIKEHLSDLVAIRRDLHAHPQLAYGETYAAQVVRDYLRSIDVPFEAGLAETGVVGWIVPDGEAGKRSAVALRADMDGLPITEQTGLDYASRNVGCMHACGHDGHTAILLGAATVLAARRDTLRRPVKLIFQPAEEGGAGAERMIRAGALDESIGGVRVGAIFGLHGWPDLPLGTLASRPGPMMASTNTIRMAVTSTGGHAALPHLYGDTVVCAASIVTQLQTIVSRCVDPVQPAVVTISTIHGGNAENIVPDRVEMRGTIRAVDQAVRQDLVRRVESVARTVAATHDCQVEINITDDYPVTVNDAACFQTMTTVASRQLGEGNVIEMPWPFMGAEDFAYYGQRVPACFGFIGLRPADADGYPGLHTPRFDFNDEAIPVGVRLMCEWATSHDS